MRQSDECSSAGPNLWYWETYDSSSKADLFACAINSPPEGLFLIDPIPLAPEALAELTADRPVAGVIVTNGNHARSSESFAARWSVPVFAQETARLPLPDSRICSVRDRERIATDLVAVAIPGAADGEMAIYCSADSGTMIIGDALINFEPYGFTFLPDKYCSDARELRASLRKLQSLSFERMLFAHGTPILANARERLTQLLASPTETLHRV